MEIIIRNILPQDYPSVLELWNRELGNRMVTAENLAAVHEQMAQDSSYQTFVAEAEGETVGFITTVQVLAAGFPVGYIKVNGLAVKNELQGNGIGRKLLQHVEQLARAKDISFIGLASGFQRTDAHAFYEHLGYNSGSYFFTKIL